VNCPDCRSETLAQHPGLILDLDRFCIAMAYDETFNLCQSKVDKLISGHRTGR
jgi:hypothetical protein